MNWHIILLLVFFVIAVGSTGMLIFTWWRYRHQAYPSDRQQPVARGEITQRVDDRLRRQLAELTILHAVAASGAEAIDEDSLIERATQIIGDHLYPDNFGLLLLDEKTNCLRPHASYREGKLARVQFPVPLGQGICGQVALQGKPRRVQNVEQDPLYLKIDPATRSELCVPLKIGDRVIGVINAESSQLKAFTGNDERLLITLAGQLATAIDRLRAESAVRHRANQLSILSRVSQEIGASLVLEQVYTTIHRATAQLMPAEVFLIALLDESSKEIDLVYFVDRGQAVKAGRIPAGQGLSGFVISSGEPVLANDLDELVENVVMHAGNPESCRSVLAAPLRRGGNTIGMLSCQSYQTHAYTKDDLQTLGTLANQAAVAIENAKLFEETQCRLSEVIFLSQIIAITATENDLSAALSLICTELAYFLHAPEVRFGLLNSQLTSAQIIAEYQSPGRPDSLGVQVAVIGNPLLAYILETSTPLVIPDTANHPLLAPVNELIEHRRAASMLLVPIVFAGEIVGLLEITDVNPREFTPTEVQLIEKVASQVGQVLERLGLFAATREQADRMAHLASISEGLNRPLTLEEVIVGIGEGAMALGRADRCVLFIWEPDGRIRAPWSVGVSSTYVTQVISRIEEMVGTILLQNAEPVLLSDVEALPESSLFRQLGSVEGFRTVNLWPLVYKDSVIAAIGCYYDQVHYGSDAEHEVFLAFARQAAIALQNARLFDEARRRAIQLEALNAIITEAAAASDLRNLLKTALDHTLWALGADRGAIWVGTQQVERGFPRDIGKACTNIPRPPEFEMTDIIAVTDWENLPADVIYTAYAPVMGKYKARATLVAPLLSAGRRIGGLVLASNQPRAWLDEEIALVAGVGSQLGGAARRLELLDKIQENARQVQQIMDTVPEGVILLDSNRQVVLANPVASEFLLELGGVHTGDTLDELGGKSLDDLLRVDAQVLWYELDIEGPPHRLFELASQPLAIGDPTGGWVVVMRDVTRERDYQTRIQMQERLATVGQLASGIAHDFNNILAAIVVYSDLLKRDPNLTNAGRERLAIIQQQVNRAASLIRQILDFSRRSMIEQKLMDMLPFIKELDKLLRRILPETIRLELSYQPGTYLVNADPTHLQQVFMNLAVNTRDASPQGGTLHFELERVEIREGDFNPCPIVPPGTWIRITVRDTGEGIPPEILPHVFEPFFTTKPIGQGTGLGLAQAYGIVKQHDGYIDVHSQVGEGATFHIYLPAQESFEEQVISPESAPEVLGAGETLLVVEDDLSTREAMRELLEAYNYHVLTAIDGKEALQVYAANSDQIDLVVSDIVMPVMGGIALYQTLVERWPDVRMLFVTGHPVKDKELAILRAGDVHCLQKPFSVRSFSQVLQGLLHPEGKDPRD